MTTAQQKKELDNLIPLADIGKKRKDLETNLQREGAKARTEARKPVWERWQQEADRIKKSHPSYSRWRIAGKIFKMFAESVDPDEKVYAATRQAIYKRIIL